MVCLSDDVKSELQEFITNHLVIRTPMDVNGRCECSSDYDDCSCRAMELTVSTNDTGTEWAYQTGDNSHTGSCYRHPHWEVAYVSHDSNMTEVANDLIADLENLLPDNR